MRDILSPAGSVTEKPKKQKVIEIDHVWEDKDEKTFDEVPAKQLVSPRQISSSKKWGSDRGSPRNFKTPEQQSLKERFLI